MKKYLRLSILFFILLFLISSIFSVEQSSILSVKKYLLKNGFTVFLNEDPTAPQVLGAVVVKVGSKHDPKDATGIAHYFEHIMFKGTDELGTIDYEKEKPLLDKISDLYDKLREEKKAENKEKIQKEINEISIEAAKYAIPNEFANLINSIGGTGLNASTSEEKTVYYNYFPSHEIEKWLDIYSQRFINPVFRLFQAELEVVYDEKNRSLNNSNSVFYDYFLKHVFKKHPYGQQTILGSVEHLRSPSISKTKKFFDTYYIANNMALILCGNFETQKVLKLIEDKFGKLKSGNIPEYPEYKEEPFKKREYVLEKILSIDMGVNSFRTIPFNHQDTIKLMLISNLLINSNKIGLLNKLILDNKIDNARMSLWQKNDYGLFSIYYYPKKGQDTNNAEKLIMEEINKIKQGNISDDLINSAKYNMKIDFYKTFENLSSRCNYIIEAFVSNISWDDILNLPNEVDKTTKQDIINIANKYFNNYLALHNAPGYKESDKLQKLDIKYITYNQNARSKYTERFLKIPSIQIKPNFVKFNEDVQIVNLKDKVKLYSGKNPQNDIITLNIAYGIGTYKEPLLKYAVEYMNLIGSTKLTKDQLNMEMAKIGYYYNFLYDYDYINIYLKGPEENLEKAIVLINDLVKNPSIDEKKLKPMIQEAITKIIEEPKRYVPIDSFKEYIIYKEKSNYINRAASYDLQKLKPEKAIEIFKNALKYEVNIRYVGKKDINYVKDIIQKNLNFDDNLAQSDSPIVRDIVEYEKDTIYFSHTNIDQSFIYFYISGDNYTHKDLAVINAFNKYFGSGMDSIIWQEIREYKSLAYQTFANYLIPERENKKGYLLGYMQCIPSKTPDAIKAILDLLKNLPEKKEKFDSIINYLINQSYTSRPDFRNIPYSVFKWQKQGFEKDPDEILAEQYKSLKFEDIINFYNKTLKNKTIIFCVSANRESCHYEELEKLGKIIGVIREDLYNN